MDKDFAFHSHWNYFWPILIIVGHKEPSYGLRVYRWSISLLPTIFHLKNINWSTTTSRNDHVLKWKELSSLNAIRFFTFKFLFHEGFLFFEVNQMYLLIFRFGIIDICEGDEQDSSILI